MQKKRSRIVLFFLYSCCFHYGSFCQSEPPDGNLRVIIIRHAEKPKKGDNLNCQGLNRSLQLPAVLYSKFGIPAFTYIPSLRLDSVTRHARMFQTVIPLAVKYNLVINSNYHETDSTELASNIKTKHGTVLIVWEHSAIRSIVRALGMQNFNQAWDDNDYDSIWIIIFQKKGIATILFDKEGLSPSPECPG